MALELISKQLSSTIAAFRNDIFWKILFISLITFIRTVSLSNFLTDNTSFGVFRIPDQQAFLGKIFLFINDAIFYEFLFS